VATVGIHDKEWLFSSFIITIKRPDVFPEARQQALEWLSNPDNNRILRRYKKPLEVLLYEEVLPEPVHDLLKSYHDDYVEQLLTRGELDDYRKVLSPRHILAMLV
jgi:hypothetical protein